MVEYYCPNCHRRGEENFRVEEEKDSDPMCLDSLWFVYCNFCGKLIHHERM